MFSSKMEVAGHAETDLEGNYLSEEASVGDKRKREGRLRSKVWQHFTKILKEDGSCGKCQCNHCQKIFTCSSRSGTTHLLRHITDGICPVFKKDGQSPAPAPVGAFSPMNGLLPWGAPRPRCMDVEVEMDQSQPLDSYHTPMSTAGLRGKLPLQSRCKSKPPNGEGWANEFRSCVGKLVELANGKLPVGLPHAASSSTSSAGPDYSMSAALRCLNEMEDINQSSEMYLDAVEIMQDGGDRECFICLPPEPRRRWLQRVLHRRHPVRYSSNM